MAQDPPGPSRNASSGANTSSSHAHGADAPNSTPAPASTTRLHDFTYPFAPSPDIIRVHQKDAYFQAKLLTQLSDILRALYGARFAQTRTTELRVIADLLYLGLTTLVGNRTLGEEYCNVVSVEADGGRLPAWERRAGHVAGVVLVPYVVGLWLPRLRRKIKDILENSLRKDTQLRRRNKSYDGLNTVSPQPSLIHRSTRYILTNLDTLTSPAPLYALSLATFYFSGSYYHLSKRIFRLRYILSRKLTSGEAAQRAGYEVLGVLLVLQLAVQGYLHFRETTVAATATAERDDQSAPPVVANAAAAAGASAMTGPGVEVSLDLNAFSSNNALLFESDGGVPSASTNEAHAKISKLTHTPMAVQPRIDLGTGITTASRTEKQAQSAGTGPLLGWLESEQARKCTLCLEPMRDPSVTTCGHVFCWSCICEWVRERPECPLCRQECRSQHVLPLRG